MAHSSSEPYTDFVNQPIGRTWRQGRAGKTRKDTNPYNGETLAEIPMAGREDMEEAMQVAKDVQPDWELSPRAERAGLMLKAAKIFVRRKEEIIGWLVKESGSTRIKAEIEWNSARGILLEAASYPTRAHGRLLAPDNTGREGRVYRRPVGVVGSISPWNFPLHLSIRSIAPALAVGNTVVHKPASDTPVSGGLLIARIFEEAGLPQGAFSVLVGPGSEIGDAFVQHPVLRFLTFTGSTAVGKRMSALVSEAPILKRVALELGGNSPFVVLDDADLDQAVNAAIFGKFLHQGQICMSINRMIVDAKLYDAFVERFTEHAKKLVCGDPSDPKTAIGPIINEDQVKKLGEIIEKARKDGARETLTGSIDGQIVTPHVFADVDPASSLAMEEIFGPVGSIIKARDEAHALEIANAPSYGLSSSVFTKDIERGVRFARKIVAGMTHVNDVPVADDPNAPFGGEKNSGIGRFNSDWLLDEMTTPQWITVQDKAGPYPF